MWRLRIRFSRGEEIKYISHLDLMRLWERTFRRASIPLAYSEGFTPHPKIALAVPLSIGVTSEGELMDIFVRKWVPLLYFSKAVKEKLPQGVEIYEVREVPMTLPSLQSQASCAEYLVEMGSEKGAEEIKSMIGSLLSLENLMWQHVRDTGVRCYDLRALVDDICLYSMCTSGCLLKMRLRADDTGTGRPEQVALAMGFKNSPKSIHRTRIVLAKRRL